MENPKYTNEYRKFNYWKLIAIIIILALIIGVGAYFGYQKYQDKLEDQFNTGAEYGIYNYISQQQQTGVFFYWDNSTGNVTLAQTSIQEICGVDNG